MQSNIKNHPIEDPSTIWKSVLAKFPDDGRLAKFKLVDSSKKEHFLLGFARKDAIYVFSFVTGTFFPLEMMIEELNDKKDLGFNVNDTLYSYLSDDAVNAIPGHSRIIEQMETVGGDDDE